MFRSECIILNIQKIRDQQFRIILFTEEFGKITAWTKKLPNGDIGDLGLCLLDRKGSENTLHSFDTRISIQPDLTTFMDITSYLEILSIIGTLSPEGGALKMIFDDLKASLELIKKTHTSDNVSQFFMLLKLRILKKYGILQVENLYTPITLYITDIIDTKELREIFTGKPLEITNKNEITKIIEKSLFTSLS